MQEKEWKLHTRADYEELLLALLNPLKPHYSEGKARLTLGTTAAVYDQDAVWAEGFLRPLWGLIPYWAGGSVNSEFEQIYRNGLVAGTDPSHMEYWGGFHDIDQRFVEMASIAYGLLMIPEILWNPLSEEEKEHLAVWLDGINHYKCPPCNWMFFGILVNVALQSVGRTHHPQRLAEYLDYIESCYEGNGWYVDGQNGEKDYYVSFAFHYYSLIYAKFMNETDQERCNQYRQRAKNFAEEFLYWFDENGSALAYGRSLTYRMAQVSFFSMCVSSELELLPYPVMKGVIARHLRFWMKQPIFDLAGVLTIGYGYPNLLMSEQYNAPGSPYWCMKVFALLSLPEDHFFWQLEEADLPLRSNTRLISNGNMLIQRTSGHVNAYVTGRTLPHHHVHMEEKYSKFLYSSRYAFSIPRSMRTLQEAAPDNMLAVVWNGMVYTKGVTLHAVANENGITMEWSPCQGIMVTTEIQLVPGGHRRKHTIKSDISCQVYDCGYAMPDVEQQTYQVNSLAGGGTGIVIQASPNTSLLYPKTVIPGIEYVVTPGELVIETEFLEK